MINYINILFMVFVGLIFYGKSGVIDELMFIIIFWNVKYDICID